jgi:hypothetical protein
VKIAVKGFTIICTVLGKAHCSVLGVKVYVPEVVLLTVAGLNVPTIPLLEIFDKIGGVAPKQMDVGSVKTGVTLFTTKIVNDNEFAHCPASGVKRYVVVAVLLTMDGFQVPVIPLVDVVDKRGAMPFLQIAGKVASNSGVIFVFTVTAAVLWTVEVALRKSVTTRE